MATKPDHKLYQYHVSNLRSIEIAIDNTARSARKAISEQNPNGTTSFVRLYSFLIGAWAETRLAKLIFEKNGMTLDERNIVLSQHIQLERWYKTIEIAFRKQYSIPSAPLTEKTLPHSAFTRYTSLVDILNNLVIQLAQKTFFGSILF